MTIYYLVSICSGKRVIWHRGICKYYFLSFEYINYVNNKLLRILPHKPNIFHISELYETYVYSDIAFGTHTKEAEPIEMPFAMMTQVGLR